MYRLAITGGIFTTDGLKPRSTDNLLLKPRKISCPRFLAQALDSTALQKNARLTYE